MALTLVESAKLAQDQLQRGVIETIIEDSPVLESLPFITVSGNSYKYNQENQLGGAEFFPVNGAWTEGTATFTEQTASIAVLGGDADVDNFIQRTRSIVNDQRAIQTQLKAKSVARKFEETFIGGDRDLDAAAFDGLRKLTPEAQTIAPGPNGGALTLALLDQLIDLVKGGKPEMLLMSKRSRRKLKSLLQASTHYVERGETAFGRMVLMYDGVPVEISDWLADDEALGNGTSLSSVYAIHFSEGDGLMGLQNGGIEVVDMGQLEAKDASRVRIRWYVGLALLRDSAVARLQGVTGA